MICRRAANYERFDIGRAQPVFEIGADKSAVHAFDDYGLFRHLTRLMLDGITGPTRKKGGVRTGTFMTNVKNRRAMVSECVQQIDDPRNGFRGVLPPCCGRPLL